MKIVVIGASGFLGTRIVAALRERGDEVVVTGRSEARLRKVFPAGVTCVAWDPAAGPIPAGALDGAQGVINLAGDSVAKGRWTRAKKRRIRDSRVVTTRNLVAGMAAAQAGPQVLVSTSAIGYYGDNGHNRLHEGWRPADDFLAETCVAWEAEAARAREHGIRTAIVRVGVVLGKDGGAYPQMTLPFRLGAGGPIGSGRGWLSWIHVDDVVGIFLHCLDSQKAVGVYNATAPEPVSNGEWTSTLASVLRRPALFPVPPIALRVMLGEFAQVVTASIRAIPIRTIGIGYDYRWPGLREAIENLEGKRAAPTPVDKAA